MTQLHRQRFAVSRSQNHRALKALISAWQAEKKFHEVCILVDPHTHEETAKWTKTRSYLHYKSCLVSHNTPPSTRRPSTMKNVPRSVRRRTRSRAGSQSSLSRKARELSLNSSSISYQSQVVSAVIESAQPQAKHSGGSKPSVTTTVQPVSDIHLQRTTASMTAVAATVESVTKAPQDEQNLFIFGTGTQFSHQPTFPFYDDVPLLIEGLA